MLCAICFHKYNTDNRRPYDVCSNRHTYCKVCVDYLLSIDDRSRCPECRTTIRRKDVILNRAADAILLEIKHNDTTMGILD
jgi:hypothetical protein